MIGLFPLKNCHFTGNKGQQLSCWMALNLRKAIDALAEAQLREVAIGMTGRLERIKFCGFTSCASELASRKLQETQDWQ